MSSAWSGIVDRSCFDPDPDPDPDSDFNERGLSVCCEASLQLTL